MAVKYYYYYFVLLLLLSSSFTVTSTEGLTAILWHYEASLTAHAKVENQVFV